MCLYLCYNHVHVHVLINDNYVPINGCYLYIQDFMVSVWILLPLSLPPSPSLSLSFHPSFYPPLPPSLYLSLPLSFPSFANLCEEAYLILRRRAPLLINLLAMMLQTGIPELRSMDDLNYVRYSMKGYMILLMYHMVLHFVSHFYYNF